MMAFMICAVTLPAKTSHAQALHGHEPGDPLGLPEITAGLAHSVTLWSTVFLAGLVAFAALVWLPVARGADVGEGAGSLFSRLAWFLFGVLVFSGMIELSLYAVSGSGESLTPALFWEALTGTRVGGIWSTRLLFSFLTALVASWAFQKSGFAYRWIALGLGWLMLMTLTQLSHAAAELRFLPFFADWIHVIAASVWMGGILGFSALLLRAPRATYTKGNSLLLGKAVRRFSAMASIAIIALLASGIYASLLYIPSLSDLMGTLYGRALIMKLGLVIFMLLVGTINLMDRGSYPFGRMVGAELVLVFAVFVATGFLTSITPP